MILKKPPSCIGCIWYGDGYGFVPDDIKPGRKVLILAQNPGEFEEVEGTPMVGATGHMMDKEFLPLASRTPLGAGASIRTTCLP